MKKTKPASNVRTLRAIRDRLNRKLEGLSSEEVLAYFRAKREGVAKATAQSGRKSAVAGRGVAPVRVRPKARKVKT